jgi:aromatic ring-opening dioxygenase catalytic subunit (LigB family)
MDDPRDAERGTVRRRDVLGGLLAATIGNAMTSACTTEPPLHPAPRLPVAFVAHGGGPWPVLDLGSRADDRGSMLQHLTEVGRTVGKPKALLVVSAHWEARVPTVMTSAQPPMYFDYHGFPPEAYALSWPAPGHPELAARVREMLAGSGFATAQDAERGYDHGTFIPLKVAFPEADVPVVQLSLVESLDASEHLALGRALAPLRDEGVFIVGSGNSFHNMGAFREAFRGGAGSSRERAAEFDAWLQAVVSAEAGERDEGLRAWQQAPSGRFAHPRAEHLIPLMVAAGAAGSDRGATTWTGSLAGLTVSSFHFG